MKRFYLQKDQVHMQVGLSKLKYSRCSERAYVCHGSGQRQQSPQGCWGGLPDATRLVELQVWYIYCCKTELTRKWAGCRGGVTLASETMCSNATARCFSDTLYVPGLGCPRAVMSKALES